MKETRLAAPSAATCPESSAMRIGPRLAQNPVEGFLAERFQLKKARAGYQRRNHVKIRVLGGRADEGDHAAFDMRQQGVLLGAVPAVHLIDEENGAFAVQAAAFGGVSDYAAQVGHAGQYRGNGLKLGLGGIGDNLRQGGFAGAGRAEENQR